MLDEKAIRLKIVEILVPAATRVGLVKPEQIVETCTTLEKYVLGSTEQGKKQPAPQAASRPKPPTIKPKGKK